MITPNLIREAKNHFACTNISGVFLENEGGSSSAGSHFEKVLFGNEIMTGIITGYAILSKFTLAILEDSGWYKVDYMQAQPFYWGKGKGCSFYTHLCKNTEEFCGAEK